MAKVTFDGEQKLIIVNAGQTMLDVKEDVYSAWKTWAVQGTNTRFLLAFSAIGGDQISEGKFLGTTYFLENGWKIRPFEGDHLLTVSGNMYSRDGSSPFVSTVGNFNVLISMNRSNLVDVVVVSGTRSFAM